MRTSLLLGLLPLPLLLVTPVAGCASSAATGTHGATSGAGSASTASSTGAGNGGSASTGSGSTAGAGNGGASSTTGTSTGGASSSASTGSSTGTTTGTGGAGGGDGGALPPGGAIVRVHYPAGSHTVTLRGSAGGLSWTAGKPMAAAGDTFTYEVSGLAAAAEWKPLLDDATWALGPNYHLAPGQTVDVWPHFTSTAGKVVTLIPMFHSTNPAIVDRPIYAYYPASYDENTDATYPVVYMHDGQNLFAALAQLAFSTPWNVDTAFDTASNQGACSAGGVVGWGAQPLGGTAKTCNGDMDCAASGGDCRTFPEAIIIGIGNTANRIGEYTPTTDPTTPGGGDADAYLAMLVNELKPKIEGMVRARTGVADTAMVGSSLGGLVTAYAGRQYPGVYGLLGEMSPSTWWDNDYIVGKVMGTMPAPNRPLRVYVDSGLDPSAPPPVCTTPDDDQVDTDQLVAAYKALGYVEGQNFHHVLQPMACHDETFWAERFPGAAQFLLGTR